MVRLPLEMNIQSPEVSAVPFKTWIHKNQLGLSIALCSLVWALLYLPHLRTSPPWYGDETLTLMIGRSVFCGEAADRAMLPTFWHPSYVYQPGYAWLAGLGSVLSGGDIMGARLLNACLALAVAISILLGGRRLFGRKAALFGALVFLTYSQSVIHFRWIYPHNAVALGFVIVVLSLLRRSAAGPDWLAGAGLALAAASHPLFVHGAFAAWLCRLKRPAAWLRMAVLPTLVVLGGIGWTIYRQQPHLWVLEDIQSLPEFYGRFSRENGAGLQVFKNIYTFFTQDFFHIGAMVAALFCSTRRFFAIPVFVAVVSGLLLQNRQNLTVFYYQAVVFLPLLAICWAGAFRNMECHMRHRCGRSRWLGILCAGLWLLPAVQFAQMLSPSLTGHIVPRNSPWVTQDCREVEAAADWLNQKLEAEDLVICHQNIGWLLKCRTADLMQATAWSGKTTFTFEKLPKRERFRYAANLADAKFLVLGDIDRRWTLGQPNVSWILEEVEKSRWPVVWQGENYIIMANPEFWKR